VILLKRILLGLFLLAFLAGSVVVVVGLVEARSANLSRKRDADAGGIRDALIAYMGQHGGAFPASLSQLDLPWDGIDTSPFKLLPPGTRSGQRNKDVVVEAMEGGKGRYRILIYADGIIAQEGKP